MNPFRRHIPLIILVVLLFLLSMVLVGTYLVRLDTEIRGQFDGRRWSLPAIVYARPLELYPGRLLSAQVLEKELLLGGYRHEQRTEGAGSFTRDGESLHLVSRGFHFLSGYEPSRHLTVSFSGDRIGTLTDTTEQTTIAFLRLDPARIGSFHPIVHEDRIVVSREEIPELLIEALLAIEDRSFYNHLGISPRAMVRALVANIKARTVVQGGSTLTQQLVKNLFLDRQRSLPRKAREAIMAMLLELHYGKDEILTAYINEVFLGQDNNRAIHGFALAAQHYFRRELGDLRADQIAILVGMVKGPSSYDPLRHPDRALQRRNMVLETMAAHKLIDQQTLNRSLALPLMEFTVQKGGFNRFPAFLDLVRKQLRGHYREKDLTTDGLQIITTLDPILQLQVETSIQRTIDVLADDTADQDLEGAALITARETGEVLALTGGKEAARAGFNRALQARRPIGSLIKPAVYLAALNNGYTLASPLEDTAITVNPGTADQWQPENYDRLEHGRVPLFTALANSYNLATVRLGLDLGLDTVLDAIRTLGYQEPLQPFPSLLLGAIEMTPYEVCQWYQTIAAGGFYTSLRAISGVMAADHRLLTRYGPAVEQRLAPQINFLLTHALQRVISEGTGSALFRSKLSDYAVAGKTGTSDDLRDSWFAGFTGNHLGVVWLGRDDNSPTRLSGSTGAMRVWQAIMEAIPTAPLDLMEPPGISWARIAWTKTAQADRPEPMSTMLPFVAGSEPPPAESRPGAGEVIEQTIKELFESINNLLR